MEGLPLLLIAYDKVATLVWQEIPTAFVIESKQVAYSYKKFFEDMWKLAKKWKGKANMNGTDGGIGKEKRKGVNLSLN